MKGSSFSEPRVEAPFAGEMERNETAPSRNPGLVFGSRSCDATDVGEPLAGGMTDGLRVAWLCAICSFRTFQTFTGGLGGAIVSEVVGG